MKYGYARVSTEDQNPALQLAALKRAGRRKTFKDERTGATTKRPALLRCLKALQNGDALIVWKLDRLARSLRDLVSMLDDFHPRGIYFRSLTEEINTTTPSGKLIFHIFAALAEFERGLIIERTRAGMKAARARGVRPGPKPELSRQQIEHARKLIEDGQRREDVADLFFFQPRSLALTSRDSDRRPLKELRPDNRFDLGISFLPAFLMRLLLMVLPHSGD